MTQRTIRILGHTTTMNMNVWIRDKLAEQAMS